MEIVETSQIVAALDVDDVDFFADINGNAPELAIALFNRFGAQICLVCLDDKGTVTEPKKGAHENYLSRLKKASIRVETITSKRKLRQYDIIASFDGFGTRLKIKNLQNLLDNVLHESSRFVVTIRKGSGSYPFLKRYGSSNSLSLPTNDADGLAIMSVEPKDSPDGEWSKIAQQLAGKKGFFSDLGEHSFLYVPRGKTLVVTFDNLDIAMTKREDRRPWGFGFIEAENWSMLGVMANGWTWFRDDAVMGEFERLHDEGFFDQFKRVVFYGASMGGYGAAAYSAVAKGSTVFVISPQSTLDKSIVPWEMRYKKVWSRDFSGPYGDASISSQTAKDVHLMYDPYVLPDERHAKRFTGKNVRHWRCPMLGHRLGSSLQQMGVLQDIARLAICGELNQLSFYKLLRKRHTFPRYQRELANLALERGRPDLALRVCRYVLSARKDRYFKKMAARITNK